MSFSPSFLRLFILKRCWIWSKNFSEFTEIMCFLSLILFTCYIYWSSYVETFLHPWNETRDVVCMYLILFCLLVELRIKLRVLCLLGRCCTNSGHLTYSWFASILLCILAFMFVKQIGLKFLFLLSLHWFSTE
jgi:hypothetical protein